MTVSSGAIPRSPRMNKKLGCSLSPAAAASPTAAANAMARAAGLAIVGEAGFGCWRSDVSSGYGAAPGGPGVRQCVDGA